MEKLTKRILAIALVAVIATGIGVGAWYFLFTEEGGVTANPYTYPGLGTEKKHSIGQLNLDFLMI